MPLPGEWIDGCSPSGGGDAPPQPDSFNLNIDIVPRRYHSSERLPIQSWDHRRLAEHASAVMPSESALAAVDFILTDHISGSFLLNYTHEIDELILGDKYKCELTHRIANVVPFWIPRRKARLQSYCLRKLVKDPDAKFNLCVPSVSGDEVEEDPFDWEDETPSLSALASDSERLNPDPAEGVGHLLSSMEHARRPQLESPLILALPQTSLGQDVFTSPDILKMGFSHDFPTVPASSCASSQLATHKTTTPTTRCLTLVRSADNDGRSSGSQAPGERASRSSEGGRRSGGTSAAVVVGCPFLCFGAGLLAPFRDLPSRLLFPPAFAFSRPLIAKFEERWPDSPSS